MDSVNNGRHFQIVNRKHVSCLLDGQMPVILFDRDRGLFGQGHLTPGGYEMFPRPDMHWSGGGFFRPFWGNTSGLKRRLISFRSSSTPRKAVFRVVTRPDAGVVESDWRMTVTYDAGFRSYVYDIVTTARVFRQALPGKYNPIEFEYFDLYPTGLLDNRTAFQFYREGRHCPVPGPLWSYLVYEPDLDVYDCNQWWIKAPLNRWITSAQNNVRVRRDGWIGFMHSPSGNPMVQLAGDTAVVSRVDMCNWFYDLHFNHVLRFVQEPPRKGFEVTARFRILSFDRARSAPILAQAQTPVYVAAERQSKAYPRFEESGVNSFERGVSLEVGNHARIWRPFHDHPFYTNFGVTDVRMHATGRKERLFRDFPLPAGGASRDVTTNPHACCLWERKLGRTGNSSLHVRTTAACIAGWNLPLFESPQLKPGRRYRLSVWIKTKALRGRGVSLGFFLDPYRNWVLYERDPRREKLPVFADIRVKGNTDWRRVELVTPVLEAARHGKVFEYDLAMCALQPVLWHEGTGASWFDDFLIEPAG